MQALTDCVMLYNSPKVRLNKINILVLRHFFFVKMRRVDFFHFSRPSKIEVGSRLVFSFLMSIHMSGDGTYSQFQEKIRVPVLHFVSYIADDNTCRSSWQWLMTVTTGTSMQELQEAALGPEKDDRSCWSDLDRGSVDVKCRPKALKTSWMLADNTMGVPSVSSHFVTWSFPHNYFCVTNWPAADGGEGLWST